MPEYVPINGCAICHVYVSPELPEPPKVKSFIPEIVPDVLVV